MRLNAPKKGIWWTSVVLGIVAIAGQFVAIPVVTVYSFWFATAGLVLLVLATYLKGM